MNENKLESVQVEQSIKIVSLYKTGLKLALEKVKKRYQSINELLRNYVNDKELLNDLISLNASISISLKNNTFTIFSRIERNIKVSTKF